ncbi:MAG: hypothetical protein V4665_03560 [Patescibacteria group bacterium]
MKKYIFRIVAIVFLNFYACSSQAGLIYDQSSDDSGEIVPTYAHDGFYRGTVVTIFTVAQSQTISKAAPAEIKFEFKSDCGTDCVDLFFDITTCSDAPDGACRVAQMIAPQHESANSYVPYRVSMYPSAGETYVFDPALTYYVWMSRDCGHSCGRYSLRSDADKNLFYGNIMTGGEDEEEREHFLIDKDCRSRDTCGSVRDGTIAWMSATSYSEELGNALSVWRSLGHVDLELVADGHATLAISDVDLRDVSWSGAWNSNVSLPDDIFLNSYFLEGSSESAIQAAISHELGHALGLDHSMPGNIMYSDQTQHLYPGPEDIADYQYLWSSEVPLHENNE